MGRTKLLRKVVEGHLGGVVDRVMIHLMCVSYLCPNGHLDGTALTSASSVSRR